MGVTSSALFWRSKKSALILEKKTWLYLFLGEIFHTKCSFKSISEKKLQNISPRGHFFWCFRRNVYRSVLILRILRYPDESSAYASVIIADYENPYTESFPHGANRKIGHKLKIFRSVFHSFSETIQSLRVLFAKWK